jgi:UDP-N-acetylmuramate dehydrogenase
VNSAQRERLLHNLSASVKISEPLAPYTSFRIGGPADLLIEVHTARELAELHQRIRDEQLPAFYLGHGSNILVSDAGFRGVVVRAVGELASISFQNGLLQAGPGARLLDLTLVAASHELTGLETLSGIPGSVGGGLYMNAGAYGGEISDTLADTDLLAADGRIVTLRKNEITFAYRSAPVLQDAWILHSRYALRPGNRDAIYREMRRVWKLRREKQPLEFPSAGSIFKRPPGDYAGRLIEAVGGKGARVGGAVVPSKHAGIFVNTGDATAADVAALVREIRRRVYNQFNILLETEVKTVGFPEDPFAIEI